MTCITSTSINVINCLATRGIQEKLQPLTHQSKLITSLDVFSVRHRFPHLSLSCTLSSYAALRNPSDESYSTSSEYYQKYQRDNFNRKRQIKTNTDETNYTRHGDAQQYLSNLLNHYQRLNVTPDSKPDVIKSAYYGLSKTYHPDVAGADNKVAAENFRLITESYDVLSNPIKRAEYDRELDIQNQNETFNSYNYTKTSSNPNSSIIFKSRDASAVFRHKQNMAYEQEMLKNPKKFRAGNFEQTLVEKLKRKQQLDMRMDRIKSEYLGKDSDGSSFYKYHLYNSLFNEKEHLAQHPNDLGHVADSSSDVGSQFFLVMLGLFLGISWVIGGLVYKIDIPDMLDSKLKSRKVPNSQDDKEDQSLG